MPLSDFVHPLLQCSCMLAKWPGSLLSELGVSPDPTEPGWLTLGPHKAAGTGLSRSGQLLALLTTSPTAAPRRPKLAMRLLE